MKASVRHQYGPPDVLHLEEVETPTPRDDEVLIRVRAASANLGDWEILRADPLFIAVMAKAFGGKPRVDPPSPGDDGATGFRSKIPRLFKPKFKILGCDIAGHVEAVGSNVTRFQPGDEVFGMCGFGAFAEYVCLSENGPLAPKPASMTFEQAAALPQASFIALQGLRDKGQLQAGQKVLINGAGGGAGTLAVQIAKSLGAEVTGVDNTAKLDMMRAIGADHVIDYTKEDFTQGGARYDVVFDNAASHSLADTRRVLTDRGVLVPNAGQLDRRWLASIPRLLAAGASSLFSRKRAKISAQRWNPEDLTGLAQLVEGGKVTPIIERTYPLAEAAQAVAYVGEGHARGKVVITV